MAGNFVPKTDLASSMGTEAKRWKNVRGESLYGDISGEKTTGINDDIQDELDLKAPLDSPELTGIPEAPTASSGTSNTQIATTAFVSNAMASGEGVGRRSLFSGLMSAVPTQELTGFSDWINQGSSTVEETSAGLTIYTPSNGATNLMSLLRRSTPVAPYAVTALAVKQTQVQVNYPEVAFGWRDSSAGKLHFLKLGSNASNGGYLGVTYWSAYNAYGGESAGFQAPGLVRIWLRLQDDETNVYFKYSFDGQKFFTLYSVAKASGYLGASGYNELFFGTNAFSYDTAITLEAYYEGDIVPGILTTNEHDLAVKCYMGL